MTPQDRSEVREMIQGVLSGWNDATVQREKLILLSLNNIDSHLDRLNGKVAAHEKTILENLPHGIQHCTQTEAIQEIHDIMIEDKGIKIAQKRAGTHSQATFNNVFTIISTVLVLIGLVVSILMGRKADAELKEQIDNFGTPVIVNSRGYIVPLPAGDSLKYFRDGEYQNSYKDSIE